METTPPKFLTLTAPTIGPWRPKPTPKPVISLGLWQPSHPREKLFSYDIDFRQQYMKEYWHHDLDTNGGLEYYRQLSRWRVRVEKTKVPSQDARDGWTGNELVNMVRLWKYGDRRFYSLAVLVFPEVCGGRDVVGEYADHVAFKYMAWELEEELEGWEGELDLKWE